ncbi:MAG: alpha-1,4-glucan--maltose-1-phosphate maltosyltransferase [Desulfatitalea sp.]|nr:alpha-1,4-glucan--maltose-1-phosphate maltosyltransferase [Desulfatitalea sp.]
MTTTFKRVIIENVQPEIDGGRFPIRRAMGESVRVTVDIFADSHDRIAGELKYRRSGESRWQRLPLALLGNDRWQGVFRVDAVGEYVYTVHAWIDPFATWADRLGKREAAGQDPELDLREGAAQVAAAARCATAPDAERLRWFAEFIGGGERTSDRVRAALDPDLAQMMARWPDRSRESTYARELRVRVERALARFSTWYELFPRSCATEPGRHGTFEDVIARLPYIAKMGFDVLYLPPIHPIGSTHRKGKNNRASADPDDPGSPWAIGGPEGGHTAVHPQLGNLASFQKLMTAARDRGVEVALDLAFQCSPDHPFVAAHPEWFRRRPDGSVQYAENPPKKYQDIFPLDFESEQGGALAEALLGIVRFWVDQGVRIFRVDNPHTKPLRFWEWLIGEVKRTHPETIFLAEAFTRPRSMYRLAKGGFTQSYSYFTWRNLKWEIEQYFEILNQTSVAEFFWPNLWPNTPDILPEYLQTGGRAAFIVRLVLAATLSSSYGIYGPVFELCEAEPREPFSEEYLDSEKYQIRHWDLNAPHNLKDLITRVNRIRRTNPALQQNRNLLFHAVGNEEIVCFSKHTDDYANMVLVVVNLDPHHAHSATLQLPVAALELDDEQGFQVHDLIRDTRYLWHAGGNFVALDPQSMPAHIFRIRRKVRTEHDFDYFM